MEVNGDRYFFCWYPDVIGDLLKLLKEIFSDMNEQQWEKCETFAKQCTCFCRYETNGEDFQQLCSHSLCNLILQKKEFYKQKNIILSTLLMNVISSFYLQKHYSFHKYFLAYILMRGCLISNETNRIVGVFALPGSSQLMEMLVNLNLVSSLKEGLTLNDGIQKELYNFISFNVEINALDKYYLSRKIMEFGKNVFTRNSLGNTKRIYLVIIAMKAIQYMLRKEESKAEENIHFLRLYMSATLDPLLTINEVRMMLYITLDFLKKIDLFESYYNEFVRLMPECSVKCVPRSLTDLARCQIRKNLGQCTLPLPVAVEKLALAQPLKRFVLGDVTEMSRKRGKVSQDQIITVSHLAELMLQR